MFAGGSISTDYTFTTENSHLFESQKAKAVSTYVGNLRVVKNNNGTEEAANPDLNRAQVKSNNQTSNIKTSEAQNDWMLDDDEDEESLSYDGKTSSSFTSSFNALAAALGVSGDKITKGQLLAFLQTLTAETDQEVEKSEQIAFIKSLIAKFDTLSEGKDYITSFNGVNEPQDYKTVTRDQVTPPVDVRI